MTALRGVQGLQRAERPGLLARSRHHQHRPAALDGLRRRAGLRDDQRADQGDQVGGRRPAVPDQLRRKAGPAICRRRGGRPSCGHSSGRSRGRRVQPARGGRDDRVVRRGPVRGGAGRSRARQPTATGNSRSRPTSTTAGCRPASGRSRRPRSGRGSPRPTAGSVCSARPGTARPLRPLADREPDRLQGFAAGPAARCRSVAGIPGAAVAAGGSDGKRSLGIGLMSILAALRSADDDVLLELHAVGVDDDRACSARSPAACPSLRSVTWIRWKPNGVSTGSEISPFLSLNAASANSSTKPLSSVK